MEIPTVCPACGGNCYDYNGTPVCEDCYRNLMERVEQEWDDELEVEHGQPQAEKA